MTTIFVTGIDTDIGKTYAVGLLAKSLLVRGRTVTTLKIAQTGCVDESEDIGIHRRLMGVPLGDDDRTGRTCPYIFPFPGSPHLAARLAGQIIDPARISAAIADLQSRYDDVVVEGVGGLCVPLNDEVTVLDSLAASGNPVVLVSSYRLGSINHTLLSIEVMRQYGIDLRGIIINGFQTAPVEIVADTRAVILNSLEKAGYARCVVDMPNLESSSEFVWDFSELIEGLLAGA